MSDLADLIQKASDDFDRRTSERHEMGAQKYGPLKFLGANVIEEAMEELLDLSNYARYMYIKLALMNERIDEELGEEDVHIEFGKIISGKPTLSSDG